jgi:hypothetical protein
MQSDNSLEKWAEENVSDEPGEVWFGKNKITKFEQIHLAVAHKGNNNDYLKGARIKIAKEAMRYGCFFVIDGDNCQNRPDERTEIFAGTGLRPPSGISLDRKLTSKEFAKLRMSHIDKKEYLRRIEDNPKNYKLINIQTAYQGKPDAKEDYLSKAEVNLAHEALKKGCTHLTNMDYIFHNPEQRTVSIAATGLIKKK